MLLGLQLSYWDLGDCRSLYLSQHSFREPRLGWRLAGWRSSTGAKNSLGPGTQALVFSCGGKRGLSQVGYPCLACVPQLPLLSLTSVTAPLLLCPGTLPPAGAMWLAHRLGCGCWFRPSLAPEVLPTLLLRSSLAPICLAGKPYHYGLLG